MRRLPLLLAVLCLLATLVVPSAASAAGAPGLTLHNDRPRISATADAKFSYRVHDLRPGSQVALQRHQGKHWRTLSHTTKLTGDHTGTFTVSGPGVLGTYRFRALVVRKHKIVLRSSVSTVYAYGAVSMRALCRGVLDNFCIDGVKILDDGSRFHYVMATGVNETSDPWTPMIGAAGISCRLVIFRYISDSQDSTHTYPELRQPGHKTQKHTSSSAQVGSFTATLSGGKFGMSVEQDAAQVFMYFTGKASCYTPTGKR